MEPRESWTEVETENDRGRGEGRRHEILAFPALSPIVLFRPRFSFRAAVSLTLRNTKTHQLRMFCKRLCSRGVSNAKRKQICAKCSCCWSNILLVRSLRESSSFRVARERASECLLSRAGRVFQLAMTSKRRTYSQAQWHKKGITRQTCFENVWPRLIVLFDEWRTFCNETAPIRQPFLTSRNNNKKSTINTHKCNFKKKAVVLKL